VLPSGRSQPNEKGFIVATYEEIIDAARDYHPEFRPRDTPNKSAFRQLVQIERRLVRDISAIDDTALLREGVIDGEAIETHLASGDPIPLPRHTIIQGGSVRRKDYPEGGETRLVPLPANQSKSAPEHFPSYTLYGGGMRLTNLNVWGNPEHGWNDYGEIRYRYVPIPDPEDWKEETLLGPIADGALTANLALWMARRLGVLRELRGLPDEAEQEEQSTVLSISGQGDYETWQIRVVV